MILPSVKLTVRYSLDEDECTRNTGSKDPVHSILHFPVHEYRREKESCLLTLFFSNSVFNLLQSFQRNPVGRGQNQGKRVSEREGEMSKGH